MIRHLVMWKLKDNNKADNLQEMKKQLLSLKDKIDVIRSIEVGIDINRSDAAYDIALVSTFDSKDDLQAYQVHPEHVKVAEFVGQVRDKRAVVDYEV